MADEIEQILARQTLRQPSPALDKRIEQTLSTAPLAGPAAWFRRINWRRVTAAAAAIVLMILTWSLGTRYLVNHLLPQPEMIVKKQGTPDGLPPVSPSTGNNPTGLAAGSTATPTLTFQRIDSELIDQGVVVAGDTGPMRKYRQETIEKIWYVDPQTQEMKEVTTPHESYVYLPLEVY